MYLPISSHIWEWDLSQEVDPRLLRQQKRNSLPVASERLEWEATQESSKDMSHDISWVYENYACLTSFKIPPYWPPPPPNRKTWQINSTKIMTVSLITGVLCTMNTMHKVRVLIVHNNNTLVSWKYMSVCLTLLTRFWITFLLPTIQETFLLTFSDTS
jgi:hypothetical protein